MEITLFTKDGCQYCDMMERAIMKEPSIPDGAIFKCEQITKDNIDFHKAELIEATGSQNIGFPITKVVSFSDDTRYVDYIVGYDIENFGKILAKRSGG